MEYKNLRVPFISKELIKNKADSFRQEFWNGSIPVDIEKIIGVKLRIDIIPIPGLEKLCNIDALISSDWQSIYVDEEKFNDERYINRLRFSLAHEIGHHVLHKDIYNSFKILSFEDFYSFIEKIPNDQYGFLETQAHLFASFLLVPRDQLIIVKEKVLNDYKKLIDIENHSIDNELLNSYLAGPVSKYFGVSSEAMEIILNKDT